MTLYKRVWLVEDVLVSVVGVHPVKWRPEWGEPTHGFVEVEDTRINTSESCAPVGDEQG